MATKVTTDDLRVIRKYVRIWIVSLKESYREVDGVVREPAILQEIKYLELAGKLLTKKHLRPVVTFVDSV